jgi:hypothetical protein
VEAEQLVDDLDRHTRRSARRRVHAVGDTGGQEQKGETHAAPAASAAPDARAWDDAGLREHV